jgi:hypothetical protein
VGLFKSRPPMAFCDQMVRERERERERETEKDINKIHVFFFFLGQAEGVICNFRRLLIKIDNKVQDIFLYGAVFFPYKLAGCITGPKL